MIALLLILIPLIGALIVLRSSKDVAGMSAFIFALIELVVTASAYFIYRSQITSPLLGWNVSWIESMGIHFNIVFDGISLVLVLLTNILVPLILLFSTSKEVKHAGAFYSLILFMQMALVGVFMSMDGFLFYIFWELALIPIYFICLLWGGEDRVRITFKFFIYTLSGSLLMLAGLIYLYLHTPGAHSFDIHALYEAGKSLGPNGQGFVFWSLLIAFGIKMPIFPLHTWQPDTYTSAPTQGTMLLSGIMLKMGTFGLVRWLIPMVPMGVSMWGSYAMVLAVIGVIYASCIAIVQTDLKRLIAYSSIAHVGLIAAGALSGVIQGLEGAIFQMFSHGVSVVALFFIVDLIEKRTHTRVITKLGGIRGIAPQFAALFLIVVLGSIALPLTSGFVGEFLLLVGVYNYNVAIAAVAGVSVILGAVYMLRSYQAVMLGETTVVTAHFAEITKQEKFVLVPLVLLIIGLGVYPHPLLGLSETALQSLINGMHLTVLP